ncbi:hypothetical protein HPP92_026062 [Vanilla planifolia]|uniref:Pollen preferential protein n=1 Tax=Vanilla planifolia TaxID=51239 RepID=A0A835PEW6_VANPL|nr:hypothetical protein HPP92_026333 [Vanilla planifolia]KAG0451804.1 hypothetical protein HPP92_026062 [Vanilla planifolia]
MKRRWEATNGASPEGASAPLAIYPPARRQPRVLKEVPRKLSKRVAEVAGGTTAECAAVVCCCPCGLLNLLVLAVVKLPAGLLRRSLRRRRKRRAEKRRKAAGLLGMESKGSAVRTHAASSVMMPWPEKSPGAEVSEKEKEMWGQFHGAGFWRSPSQRE